MKRRQLIWFLGSVLVAVWFTPSQTGLSFSIAQNVSAAYSQTPRTLSVPADSPSWSLQGQAKPADYQGRKCLFLDGGAAVLNELEMRDGVVDMDVATPASRGFFGIQFRISGDGANGEWVYLRQHKSGLPDALQYTPVLNNGLTGKSIMGRASPARSISRKMSGSTCAWR